MRSAESAGPVTTSVTRRVKPGHEEAYEAFLEGIIAAASRFPGYLGVEVFRPDGPADEYRTVYRFDGPGHLRDWLDSDEHQTWLERAEPHVIGPMHTPRELVHPSGPAWCRSASALQDGAAHLAHDLPSDHRRRHRSRAAARAHAARAAAWCYDGRHRPADDLDRDAADDPGPADVALPEVVLGPDQPDEGEWR
jgi:heme-degrading monooxygenase HmoA